MIVAVIRNPQTESKFISLTCSIPRRRWKKKQNFLHSKPLAEPAQKDNILGAEILGESCELGFHEFFETLERNSSGIRTNNMDKWMFSTLRWRPHLIIASSLVLMVGQGHRAYDCSYSSSQKACREVVGSFISLWL